MDKKNLFQLLNRKDRKQLKNEPLNQNILGSFNNNEPFNNPYTNSQMFNADWHNQNPIHLGSSSNGSPTGDYVPSRHAPVYDLKNQIPSNSSRGLYDVSQLYKVPWNAETDSYDPNSSDRRFFNYNNRTGIDNKQFNRTDLNRELHRDLYADKQYGGGFNSSDSLSTQEVYDKLSNENSNIKFNDEAYGKFLK